MAVKSDYVTGTVTLTNGSTAFTGAGTAWALAGFREGDEIMQVAGQTQWSAMVATITSNTAGTLVRPWGGATGTYAYRLRFQADGQRVTAQARNLIELLGDGTLLSLAGLVGPGIIELLPGGGAQVVPKTDLVSGANYDVQVASLAARAAYNGQATGFAVLVSDVGDGRSAIYSKNSNTSADWSAPAYVTGPTGAPSTVAGVVWRGTYAAGTVYAVNDGVTFNGSSFRKLTTAVAGTAPSSAAPPVNTAAWEVLAAKGANGAGTGDVVGPASSADGDFAAFSSATGKALKVLAPDAATAALAYNAGTTGLAAPYISARERLRVNLNASSVKMLGDDSTNNISILNNVLTDISNWGGGRFHINRDRTNGGVYRVGATLNIPPGVYLYGDGDGASVIKGTGNFAVLSAVRTSSTVQGSGGARDLTIRGAGMTNTNAHGVSLAWVNRMQFRNLRFFGCRDAFRFSNVWQVHADHLHADGVGTDQNYNGFMGLAVDPTNQNNAVIASNCMMQNINQVGYRLINFNGSKFVNCEVAGAGGHGWYLGAPTSGTEIVRWGHFSNCLSDTVGGSGLRLEKGAATDMRQIQFDNFWIGTTGGPGLETYDTSSCNFSNFKIASTAGPAIALIRTSRCNIIGANIDNYNTASNGRAGIELGNSSRNQIVGNHVYTTSSGTGVGIVESGTSNDNLISDNETGFGMALAGSGTIAKGNQGYRTYNSGRVTVAAGTNSVIVSHGLSRTPGDGDFVVSCKFDYSAQNVQAFWIDTITATTFTLKTNNNPTNSIDFHWQGDVSRG